MEPHLFSVSVGIPPLPQDAVPRLDLIQVLEQGVRERRLILLSAPAGYGKTTLLSQWARTTCYDVAWLSAQRTDNDQVSFLRRLLNAWERVQPGVIDSALGLLLGSTSPNIDATLAAFTSEVEKRNEQIAFVVDDYHLIDDASTHQVLTHLVDQVPPESCFVLGTRSDPPLPLARYRARRQLLELRTGELKFSAEEAQEFLANLVHPALSEDELTSLIGSLEGWITGLRLVALSLQRSPNSATRRVVAGRHRFIADYFAEDVIVNLTQQTLDFLLRTSILDQLRADLCNAVTGRDDGHEMLSTLERQNLFVSPLDDYREWYRYHPVFADYLRAELERVLPEETSILHCRAAQGFLENGLPELALTHAVAGDSADIGAQIFDRHFYAKLLAAEVGTLRRWMSLVPVQWMDSHPTFHIARSGLLMFEGDFEGLFRELQAAEHGLATAQREDARPLRGRVIALRCFIACFQNDLSSAQQFADQALPELPEHDLDFRAGIHGALGDTYRANGFWREARECYSLVLDHTRAPSFQSQSVHVYGALADLSLMQGHLREAADYWKRALSEIESRANWGKLPLVDAGWVYVRMGELLYEWNELRPARDHVAQGLERAEIIGDIRGMIAGYLIAGRIDLTEGDIAGAEANLARVRPLISDAPFPDWTGRFDRLQLELWLAQDRRRTANDWASEMLNVDELPSRAQNEATRLALARALIWRSDRRSLGEAEVLLEHLIESAADQGRTGVEIEARALLALMYRERNDAAGAMTALLEALQLAAPEGFVRTFSDLGLPMGRLLQEAHARSIMPQYVERVLSTFDRSLDLGDGRMGPLPEPLTERETEIVGLLTAGLTNIEIAEKLFISPETVKKHTRNIYAKLGVHSRVQAVTRAQTLGLLN